MPMDEMAATAAAIFSANGYSSNSRIEGGKVILDAIDSDWTPATRSTSEAGRAICRAFREAKLSFRNYYDEQGSYEYGCHVLTETHDVEVALSPEEIERADSTEAMDELLDRKLKEQGF